MKTQCFAVKITNTILLDLDISNCQACEVTRGKSGFAIALTSRNKPNVLKSC